MKTKFWVSFHYGGWKLIFTKTVDLPFAPFIGLMIMDDKEIENIIQLNNNENCRTTIMYDLQDNEFDVDVYNIWKQPVTEEAVDDILEKFEKTGWKREDNEDAEKFKKIMRDNYEKNKNR